MRIFTLLALLSIVMFGCSGSGGSGERVNTTVKEIKEAPAFNADSAYYYVEKQVSFGPRVPNSEAHKKASAWFKSKFEAFGAKVTMQEFEDYVYSGTKVELVNVIASYNLDKPKRILLAAHWDTRPFADHNDGDKYAAIDGANDGGSGVGVLLEVARVINANPNLNVGVDIILFDGEDWGEHTEEGPKATPAGKESWWCLGSQYWAQNKHKSNYSAYYGILLDMVGAQGATFYYDGVSQQNASKVMEKVWDRAHYLGHNQYFIKELGFGGLTDDHVFINKLARIPMIDIIDYREGNFMPAWHTENDNMDIMDPEVLKVVGEVVLSMIYNE